LGANLGYTKGGLESYQKAAALLDAALLHQPENHDAQLTRVTVLQRIGAIHLFTQQTGRALTTFREAQGFGESLLKSGPTDARVAAELAQVYISTGDALLQAGASSTSVEEHTKAVALLEKFSANASNDAAIKKGLAAAYSALGLDETRLGRLEERMGHYRQALSLIEELTRQSPANASYQRILMSIYSHLGDVLGNPKWRSLGDAEGALKAYRQMLTVAGRLYETDPANQQAAGDYAVALTRVAAVLPREHHSQQISMLRESLRLQREIQQVNPHNLLNRWDLTHGYWLLADALIATDRAGAVRAYQECITLGEALIAAGVYPPARDLVNVHGRLAILSASDGDREAALRHARRALEISEPASPIAKGLAETVRRFLTPLGSGAMGLTYAALARQNHVPPEVAREDRLQAREWLKKSLATWRQLEPDPAFAPPHRKEMQKVEMAAAEMNRLW
jgi:tetratricopeptide (TPR) repeat protein